MKKPAIFYSDPVEEICWKAYENPKLIWLTYETMAVSLCDMTCLTSADNLNIFPVFWEGYFFRKVFLRLDEASVFSGAARNFKQLKLSRLKPVQSHCIHSKKRKPVLNFKIFSGIFLIWATGCLTSLCVLLLEKLYFYWCGVGIFQEILV